MNYRYVEQNVFFSGKFKRYNESIPVWLHNRPREFVRHCTGRMLESTEIKIEPAETGMFKIMSNSTHQYTVNFGSQSDMPSCTCPDLKKNKWPCKHFLAVFAQFPEWGWDALPLKYKENPIFNVDQACYKEFSIDDNVPVSPTKDENMPNKQENSHKNSLTSAPKFTQDQKLANNCREVLKEILNLTYLCSDTTQLQILENTLKKAKRELKENIITEEGLIVREKPQVKQNQHSSQKQLTKEKYTALPLRKKKTTTKIGEQIKKPSSAFCDGLPKSYDERQVCHTSQEQTPAINDTQPSQPQYINSSTSKWQQIYKGLLTPYELSCLDPGMKLNDLVIDAAIQ